MKLINKRQTFNRDNQQSPSFFGLRNIKKLINCWQKRNQEKKNTKLVYISPVGVLSFISLQHSPYISNIKLFSLKISSEHNNSLWTIYNEHSITWSNEDRFGNWKIKLSDFSKFLFTSKKCFFNKVVIEQNKNTQISFT